MPRILLRLDSQTEQQLSSHPETGMGFYVAMARAPNDLADRIYVIAGDNYLLPIVDPDYFCVSDLLEGTPFPVALTPPSPPGPVSPAAAGQPMTLAITSTAWSNVAQLPPGYRPVAGAIPLLATATLGAPTPFYRYIGSPNDPRFMAGSLARDTYLTCELDRAYANTGFAAVGRYALPLPVPASYVHIYVLPAHTKLLVGTALPSFGQAGGGVEVKLPAAAPVAAPTVVRLDDF